MAWNDYCGTVTSDQAGTYEVRLNVTGLMAGTTYEARYRYRNSSSCSGGTPGEWSGIGSGATPSAATAPTAAPGDVAVAAGVGQLTITWSGVAESDDGGSPITGYIATATPTSGDSGECTTDATGTGCTIGGLASGVSYDVTVVAENAIGRGPASAAVKATTTVAPPISGSYRFIGERPDDRAGWSLGTVDLGGGGGIVIGAPFHSPSGREERGAVYLVAAADLATADLADGREDSRINLRYVASQPASWKIVGQGAGDRAGWSVSFYEAVVGSEGLVITAPGRSSTNDRNGAAYLLAVDALAQADAADGSTDGIIDLGNVAARADSWEIVGRSGTTVGTAVVPAGDVDGDGQREFLLHARQDDEGGGALAYLVSVPDLPAADEADGNTDGTVAANHLIAQRDSWRFEGTDLGGRSGLALASAGDTDGDMRADLLFGGPGWSPAGRPAAGAAWLAAADDLAAADRGSGNAADGVVDVRDLASRPDSWQLNGERAFDQAGAAVASAGDVDGDGLDDLIVGAPHHSRGGNISGGAAYLIASAALQGADNADGSADGIVGLANISVQPDSWKFVGEGPDDEAGVRLMSAGDVDGDGMADVLIGADDRAAYYLIATSDLPAADAADGTADGVVDLGNVAGQPNSWAIEGQGLLTGADTSLAAAGDLDGDGVPDVVIGDARNENGAGGIYLAASRDLARADAADGRVDGVARLDWIGAAPDDLPPPTEAAGVLVGTVRGNTVGYNSTAEFDVRLLSRPSGDVVIPVSSSDESQGVVEQEEIVVGPDDWNMPRTVVVRGRDREYRDGVRDYEIVIGPTRSIDPAYRDLQIPNVSLRGIILELAPPAQSTPLLADNEAIVRAEVSYTGNRRLSFSLTKAPDGMEIDLSSGEIAWTPAESDEGSTFDVGVSVNDGGRFAETAFEVSVAQPTLIATSLTANVLTVTDTDTNLEGMTISPLDGSGDSAFPDDATTELGDLNIALMPDTALQPIPDAVERLSDAFVVKRPHGAGVSLEIALSELASGSRVNDVRLYSLTTAHAQDSGGPVWSPAYVDMELRDEAGRAILRVDLDGLHGVLFFGAETLVLTAPPAPATQPTRDIECTPRRRWPWDGPGEEYKKQTCTHADLPELEVTVRDFGTSADSTLWGNVAIVEMVEWLVESRAQFDALDLDYDGKFNVEIFYAQPSWATPGSVVLGYVTSSDNRKTLHLYGVGNNSDRAKSTAAHEYFHHAQARSDRAGYDPLIDYVTGDWLIEGSARWFEDFVFDHLDVVYALSSDTRFLEEGLAHPVDSLAAYRRFTFVKLLEGKCPNFNASYRNMINVESGGLLSWRGSEDPRGLAQLVVELGTADCDFGDHFGADRKASLEAALAYYSYATMFKRDIALLDPDETSSYSFQRPNFEFDRERQWMADASNWSNLATSQLPTLQGVDRIPVAGAYSFWVYGTQVGTGFEDKVAELLIESSAELLVSVTSDSPSFGGINTIGTEAHIWFSTTARQNYVYDGYDGVVDKLFVTLVNPSITSAVDVDVRFNVRDAISADAVITSHSSGDEVHRRVVSVAGTIPEAARSAVSKVVVTANGLATETQMNADGTFAAEVVVSLGDNTVKAQGFGASAAVTNAAIVTIRGVESTLSGRNALIASRLVLVLRWDTEGTDVDIYSTDKENRSIWWGNNTAGPGNLDYDDTDGLGPEVVSYRAIDDDIYANGTFDVDVHYYSGSPSTHYTLDVVLNEQHDGDRRLLRFDSVVPLTVSEGTAAGPNGFGDSRFNDLLRISCSGAQVCTLSSFDDEKLRQAGTETGSSVAARERVRAGTVAGDGSVFDSAYERCILEFEAQIAKSGRVDWYCNADGTKIW